ncbi:thermostable hemolysin [Marinobacter oulmenensis]|uniref:Thermostable hemolysin n=1 Tax=Marinobacter oulmenensis TaxID=643747 RepID=A0A840UF61_9GAMM|nr:thermostable hemolysin [Marinobacter oulmenensis]MBB5321035.1 hypothetical protein [Marinobacter oulmenensis]
MTDPIMLSTCCLADGQAAHPVVTCAGRLLSRIAPETDTADAVAGFIRRRFLQAYGAEPILRIPDLLALTSAQGTVLAAAGVRNAGKEKLFLEDYLGKPVESALPEPCADRDRVAEIAHLAGVEAGISRYLFACLSVWLDSENYDWVVCTGTDQLRNSFHRLGITTQVLGEALAGQLPDRGAGWGAYYQHHPQVLAIRISDSLSALQRAGLLQRVRLVPGALPDEGGRYGRTA